ncbi:C-type lectin BfL-2-like [Sceloporus undulatus]|uniref:C-type lectin BfL-2-like n=1 Tax=Sceloporus undulatus TaxID=8520 RepID=UPI001C4AFCDA|nr:C-type lectin BfL-2-like [Sceloporus undulatus]
MAYQKYCYGLFTRKLPWKDAEQDCQSYGYDSHLASIRSVAQSTMISSYILFHYDDDEGIWIGLSNPQQNGAWQWSDRSTLTYWPWDSGKPSVKGQEACAHLSATSGIM